MDWFCSRITDYWNPNTDAIGWFAAQMRALSQEELARAGSSLSETILEHTRVLSDADLLRAATILADDSFKSVWVSRYLDHAVSLYLNSSASVFLNVLRQRGYVLHYFVDNTFPQTPDGFQPLLDVLGLWFESAGFVYICPQAAALDMMAADGIARDSYFVQLNRYMAEARYLAHTLMDRCQATGRHYVLIDADFEEELIPSILKRDRPGILTVFRNEPPVKGTKLHIVYPIQRADTQGG
jgi:hypothetical protein